MKAVDLFCGAGGSSTGAAQAGVTIAAAVNWATEHFARVFTTDDVVQQGVPAILEEVRRISETGPPT